MKKESEQKKLKSAMKSSIVVGGLIGTMGLFVAKLLGLLYSIPLSSILGSDELMSYYGTAYLVYSYILNIFTAGVPFAICTIVAKYTELNDNRSLKKIKYMSNRLMVLLGLAGMALLLILSNFMAGLIADGSGTAIMANCLRILALAIFFVPILSGYRGFWQGRKEMGEYALSQTFEQIFRVAFLLSSACLIVYAFHLDRTYALYAAVLSTSIAAIAGIIQIKFFDRKNYGEILDAAKLQKTRPKKNEELFHELIALAVPYLLTAIIGYCDEIYNSTLLPVGLRLHGYSGTDLSIILSAINYVGYKLTSIPQILSPGFAAALIPHVTEAMLEKNYKRVSRVVIECIGIVCFIGSVLSVMIAVYAPDIYNIMFYTSDVALSSDVVRWISIEGFLGTVVPISSSLMIALGLKKDALKRMGIHALIKGILIVPFITLWGYRGAVLSSMIGYFYIFTGNLRQMDRLFDIHLKSLVQVAGKIAIALVIMTGVTIGLKMIGISGETGGRLIALAKLAVNAIISMVVYLGICEFFKVPETLFHRNIPSLALAKLHKNTEKSV